MTWEPERSLTHVPELLRQFWEAKELPCPHAIQGLESEDELSPKGGVM
jgi:hypothetical protein